jgi:hypothetical protein
MWPEYGGVAELLALAAACRGLSRHGMIQNTSSGE